MNQIKWLWRQMDKTRGFFIAGLMLSALSSVMLIVGPFLSQRLIDEVIVPNNPDKLIEILMLMFAVHMVRLTMRYIMVLCFEKNSEQVMMDVRTRLYHVIQNQDHLFGERMKTGDLMTRMTSDLNMLRHATAWIAYQTMESIVIFLSAMFFLTFVNWKLTLCLIAVTPFILICTRIFSKRMYPLLRELRVKQSNLSVADQESIEGNRVVKAFTREEYEKVKFSEKNRQFREVNLKVADVGAKFQPLLELLSQTLMVITLLIGGLFMINHEMTAGGMMAFTSLIWALSNPLRNFGMLLSDLQRFFTSADRLIEVYNSRSRFEESKGNVVINGRLKGKIEYQKVSFSYGSTSVLKDISFTLEAGQTLGIIGTTGAGKTTLVNMLNRTYEPDTGRVLLDDRDVSEYYLNSLRDNVAVAMQDVFLFSDTIRANIAYGRPDMTQDEIEYYARIAGAHDFIQQMPEGYDTLVGELGVGLSGGQKQRITLARALAQRPAILVLDDITSAVDMEKERYIQSQIRQLPWCCTKIIIAQRVSALKQCDLILVMDKGIIIERGTHSELLAKQGYYYSMWALQNGQELRKEGVC